MKKKENISEVKQLARPFITCPSAPPLRAQGGEKKIPLRIHHLNNQTQTDLRPRMPRENSRAYRSTVVCVSVKRDTTYITNAAQGRRHDPSHFWFQERWRRMWSDGHPGPNTRHVVYCRELAASTGGSQENRINPPPFRIFQCGASGFSVIRETFFFCFCLYWENVLKSGILKISSVKISSQTNSLLKTKLY